MNDSDLEELHKSAHFLRKTIVFARAARAFLILVHFVVVFVKTRYQLGSFQFNSWAARAHFTCETSWNIRKRLFVVVICVRAIFFAREGGEPFAQNILASWPKFYEKVEMERGSY